MTDGEVARIDERFNEQAEVLGDIKTSVSVMEATCGICRPIVLGDGTPGTAINGRVSLLEDRRIERRKGFWAMIALVSAVVAGVVTTIVAVCF